MSIIPLSTSIFFNFTDPSVFGIKLVRILKVVDFPEPLGPSKPKISPFFTPKLLFLIAVNPLSYYLDNFVTFTISSQSGYSNLSCSLKTSISIYIFFKKILDIKNIKIIN